MKKNRSLRINKKAFTLIELLAVLVILTIIALIAVPIILGIVEQARRDAFVRSVELVVSTTTMDMSIHGYSEEHLYTMKDGIISNLSIDIQNTKGMNGKAYYDVDGNVTYAFHNEKWCVMKSAKADQASITDYKEDVCTIEAIMSLPTISIKVKSESKEEIESDTWVNEKLTFLLQDENEETEGNKLYYCIDQENSCDPKEEVSSATEVSLENTGIFYIRYKIRNAKGIESLKESFIGKVDIEKPEIKEIEVLEVKENGLKNVKIQAEDQGSGVEEYCLTKMKDATTCEWKKEAEIEAEAGIYYVYIKDKAENTTEEEKIAKVSYEEYILHGADPEYTEELIPVRYEDGKTIKASMYEKWYSYTDKTWANAVVLFNKDTYEEGQVIPESAIKQYYVWIPRYKYKLWNVNSEAGKYPNGTSGPSAINITFESKDISPSEGTANGEYLTHPAFTAFNTNGLWVGKFETSYNENTFTNKSTFLTSNSNFNIVIDAVNTKSAGNNIIIKPNVRSLTALQPSKMYEAGREINPSARSHMMKNMEWGAVAYLTYSEYGKCTKSSCEEVYINNVTTGWRSLASDQKKFSNQWEDAPTITGCSADSVSATTSPNHDSCTAGYAWNENGVKASTTGNMSGIYDMSGGNWEYMMSVVADSMGNPVSGRNNFYNSGYNGIYGNPGTEGSDANQKEKKDGIDFPLADKQYYDLYEYKYAVGNDKWNDYTTGYLGDATKELAPTNNTGDRGLWFTDYALFASVVNPWFMRSGLFYDSVGAGPFFFSRFGGDASVFITFRVVLAI